MVTDAQADVANVREASEQAKEAVADFRGERGPVKGLTAGLQQTLTTARDAMSDLAESTEALKRNFFFRGFFNRRGYFDLDDVSPTDYRRGALRDRRPPGAARSGCRRDVLFATDASGKERADRRRPGAARFGDVRVPPLPAQQPVRRRRLRARWHG